MKRIVSAAAAVVVAGIVGFAGASPAAADQQGQGQGQDVCPGLDSTKIDTTGNPLEVPRTAPDGMVITEYCVKAGSDASVEEGAVRFIPVNPPQVSVTITHPSKKSVSHYSLSYGVIPVPPGSTIPTCEAPGGVTIPPDTKFYTYSSKTENGVTEVTVSPVGDVELVGDIGPWSFEIEGPAEGCTPPPPPPEPSLKITALSPVCLADIPYIDYAVALDGLDPAGKTATLTIRDKDGKEVSKLTGQPLAGRILYPGASAEPKDWPGWKFANGKWEFDPTDARVREGVTVTAEVNPSATGSVSYPAATEKCNSPEIVTASGPVPPAAPAAAPPAPAAAPPAPVTALPTTGSSSWLLALLATMLVLAGSGFVAVGRRTR